MVGKRIDPALIEVSPINQDRLLVMRDVYDTLIADIFYMTYPDGKAAKCAKRCIDWLSTTDFYIASASTIHHDCEPGGLLRHSLRVAGYVTQDVAGAAVEKIVFEYGKSEDFYLDGMDCINLECSLAKDEVGASIKTTNKRYVKSNTNGVP